MASIKSREKNWKIGLIEKVGGQIDRKRGRVYFHLHKKRSLFVKQTMNELTLSIFGVGN